MKTKSVPAFLTLYKGNKVSGKYTLSVSDAVAQFKASEYYKTWQDGWPLQRALAVFIAYTLDSVMDRDANGMAEFETLYDAVLAAEKF